MKYLYVFLLIGVKCLSQYKDKRVYYFDENWKSTSGQSFKKIETDESKITTYFDMDTAYIAKIFLFENYGKLESGHLAFVKKHLEKVSGRPLDATKPIVINYVSAIDPNSKNPATGRVNIYDTSNYKGNQNTKKRTDINLLWLQHPDNKPEIGRYSKKVNWLLDNDNYIAKTFLEYNCHIGSLIIIMPDGSYLAYYCIERIFDEIDEVIDRMKNVHNQKK